MPDSLTFAISNIACGNASITLLRAVLRRCSMTQMLLRILYKAQQTSHSEKLFCLEQPHYNDERNIFTGINGIRAAIILYYC